MLLKPEESQTYLTQQLQQARALAACQDTTSDNPADAPDNQTGHSPYPHRHDANNNSVSCLYSAIVAMGCSNCCVKPSACMTADVHVVHTFEAGCEGPATDASTTTEKVAAYHSNLNVYGNNKLTGDPAS
jgi:hypothetical protein